MSLEIQLEAATRESLLTPRSFLVPDNWIVQYLRRKMLLADNVQSVPFKVFAIKPYFTEETKPVHGVVIELERGAHTAAQSLVTNFCEVTKRLRLGGFYFTSVALRPRSEPQRAYDVKRRRALHRNTLPTDPENFYRAWGDPCYRVVQDGSTFMITDLGLYLNDIPAAAILSAYLFHLVDRQTTPS